MQALMDTENQEGIEEMLIILLREEPEACRKVELVLSDLAKCFWNAWLKIIGPGATHGSCIWHVDRAWFTNIKNETLLEHLKELRLVPWEQDFKALLDKLERN